MLEQQHGNYKAYYRKRCFDTEERIASFKLEWFEGKKCVDIGCNEGAVTLKLAEALMPNFIFGIDLDPRMIDAANAALKRAKHSASKSNVANPTADALIISPTSPPSKRLNPFLPRSIALHKPLSALPINLNVGASNFGNLSSCSSNQNLAPANIPGKFPDNVSFVCKNVIDFTSSTAKYDVVSCLSVTKWIHLTEGDSGLQTLFHIIYQMTSPGGRAIIEYQPWSSYLNNKKTSPTTLRVFNTLKIRPEDFELILTRDVGFRIEARLGTPLSEAKGFKRPILVLIKDFDAVSQQMIEDSDAMEIEPVLETKSHQHDESRRTGYYNASISGSTVMGRKRYFGELEPEEAADMLDETDADSCTEDALASLQHNRRKKKV